MIIASKLSPPGSESFARRVSASILIEVPGVKVTISCCAKGTVGSIIFILTFTGSLLRAPFDTTYVNESRTAFKPVFTYEKVPLLLKSSVPKLGVSPRIEDLETSPCKTS